MKSGVPLASEHIGAGNCYDDPVEIRRYNDSTVPTHLEKLYRFCCGVCEDKGCSACGSDQEVTCQGAPSPVFIFKNSEDDCYVNCICEDLDEGHNVWVIILRHGKTVSY